jgi:N-acetylglucosaminyl-diphospho-decaprenol L-rhamnosyltransferase
LTEISVIIVAFRSADIIIPALKSVAVQQGAAAELVVVDNGAEDGLEEILHREVPGAWFVRSSENEGYGRGNNRGVRMSTGDLILLLNPDAELVSPSALSGIVRAFGANPQWGLAGLRTLDQNGAVSSPPARTYPAQKRSGRDFTNLPGDVAWVLGAGMAIRRSVFQRLGGFDPDFFLYSEETDFCLRAREAGWSIGHLSDVVIRHVGGASEMGRDPGEITRRKMAGMHRFWVKHYGADRALALARRDALRSAWRKSICRIQAMFGGRNSTAWRKHRHYAGLHEASRQFLERRGVPLSFEEARRTVTGQGQ